MKKMYKLKQSLKLLAIVIFVGWTGTLSAQLSGAYTIDNTVATGGTNYNTFLAFQTAIVTNGVSGAVTVKFLTNQTEATQIVFSSITGASATNTITIDGNAMFLSIPVATEVISMNGADYFTFKNLTLRNTSTSTTVQGVRFYNNADNNTVDKCTIELTALTTGSTGGGAYISFASSGTALTTTSSTNNGMNNTISNNLMRTTNTNSPGPTFGVIITGSTSSYTSTAQNNTVTGNTIQNFYYMAVYMYFTNGNQILNNDISRANSLLANTNSTLYGIYSYYGYSTSRSQKLDGNNLHDWPYLGCTAANANGTTYAFYTYYNNNGASSSTNRFTVSNNTIKNVKALNAIYLGYNYYNHYFDLNGNMADDNDVNITTSSAQNFYGYQNFYNKAYNYNNNTIQNCDGGYYWFGIYNNYSVNTSGVSPSISGNNILKNTKMYFYFHGITSVNNYNSNTSFININDNTIKDNATNYYYMMCISTFNQINYFYSWGYVNIQRNKIINNQAIAGNVGYLYGIYTYYDYDLNVTDNMVADNIGYYSTYNIFLQSYLSGNYTANIRQNTIKFDGSKSSYAYQFVYGLYEYLYYHSTVNVQGNIIDMRNINYYGYIVYCYNTVPTNIKWDRNSYFVSNVTNQQWYCPSGGATSFTGWNGLGFAGPNEKYGDPKWNNASTFDLRSNTLMNQNNIPYNALNVRDANQVLRNTSKNDRGSLEGYLDIQNVSSDFAPSASECSGYTFAPTVTLKNNFIDDVTGFDMALSVNGVLITNKTVTSNIIVNGTGTLTFAPVKFSKAGVQKVKIFLLDADDNPANDTLTYTFNIKVAPGGGALSLNSAKSAAKAHFDITGKPDITTNGQAIVYDLTPPSRVGYTNVDHLFNGGSKWIGTATGATKFGVAVPASQIVYNNPAGSTNAFIAFTPSAAFVDSLVTISFKVTDFISGCDTTFKRTVLVAPQGVPGIKLPTIICDKDEVFFENTSTVSSGALLSTWDFGDGSATVDATSPVYKYNGPGTYTVTLTVVTAPYGYVTKITKLINVNEIPSANFKNVNACAGTAIKLTNTTTIGSGTLTYVWNYGDGSPNATTTNTTKLYGAPGGYKVTLSASGNGCVNVVSKNVYQFARPVASFTKTAGSCENDVFEFMNNSSISQGEFGNNWDFNDGGNKATVAEPKYDFLTSGVKKVKLRVISEFGCIDSMETSITVKTIATTSFTAPFACSRTSTQFTNTTNLNGEALQSYEWNFGDGFTSSAFAPVHPWTSIGPKIVKLKTSLVNGCVSEVSQILNVGVQPKVDFQFADQCAGSEVQFANLTSFTQGNISYVWDFGDNNKSTIGSPKHTYSIGVGTQTFTVMLKASIAGGCKDSLVKTININPLPTTCDFDMTRDYSTSLTAYKLTPKGGASAGINYTWLLGDGSSVSSVASGTTYSYSGVGKYCVTMVAKNTSGCECTKTKCETLVLDVNSAAIMNNLITIFPNPTNGIFNVKLDAYVSNKMTVNVYNAIGELVKTVIVDTNNANIDLSAYANGVYVVKVTADNQVATKQIILNK